MKRGSFVNELRMRLNEKPFNLQESLNLSERLIHLEIDGYQVGQWEDRLWAALTSKIEIARADPSP